MSERDIPIPDIFAESKVVGVGSTVKIHYLDDPDGYMETVSIVRRSMGESESGVQEAPIESPLGQALVGNGIGDIVHFPISDSDVVSVQIIDVK